MRRTAVAVVITGLLGLTGCGGDSAPSADGSGSPKPAASSSGPAASPSGSARTTRPTVTIAVRSGKVVEGSGTHRVKLGSTVVLEIVSDVADHVHLHGYDVEATLKPGKPARLTFTADVPGVFEVETHESGLVLCELRVQ